MVDMSDEKTLCLAMWADFAVALNKLQSEVDVAKRGKVNSFFKGAKYADLEAVWEAIREPLTSNGFSVIQFPCEAPAGNVGLKTTLMYKNGVFLEDKFFMPLKDPTNPQAAGSALTYARRYALMAVVGISPSDDDGNAAASNEAKIKKAQAVPADDFIKKFTSAKTLDAKKEVYLEVKSSALPTDEKTSLLKSMGQTITEMKVKING